MSHGYADLVFFFQEYRGENIPSSDSGNTRFTDLGFFLKKTEIKTFVAFLCCVEYKGNCAFHVLKLSEYIPPCPKKILIETY